jgi:hypothetical protein
MSQLSDLFDEMMGAYTEAAEQLDNEDMAAHVEALAAALRWSDRYHAEADQVLAATDGGLR